MTWSHFQKSGALEATSKEIRFGLKSLHSFYLLAKLQHLLCIALPAVPRIIIVIYWFHEIMDKIFPGVPWQISAALPIKEKLIFFFIFVSFLCNKQHQLPVHVWRLQWLAWLSPFGFSLHYARQLNFVFPKSACNFPTAFLPSAAPRPTSYSLPPCLDTSHIHHEFCLPIYPLLTQFSHYRSEDMNIFQHVWTQKLLKSFC